MHTLCPKDRDKVCVRVKGVLIVHVMRESNCTIITLDPLLTFTTSGNMHVISEGILIGSRMYAKITKCNYHQTLILKSTVKHSYFALIIFFLLTRNPLFVVFPLK